MRRLSLLVCVVLTTGWGCTKALPPKDPTPPTVTQSSQPGTPEESTGEQSPAERSPAESEPPPQLLSAEQVADGWIALFDGQTLFGWKANKESTNWSVEDGVIRADSGDPGLLTTSVPWADFELTCDVRLETGGNSGIFLRTVVDPEDPTKDCYELNVCDTHPEYKSGSLVGRAQPAQELKADGRWTTFHVLAEGQRLRVSADDRPVLDYTDTETKLRSGLIGLQMNGGKVEFRNVFLRPLGMQPIFGGEDLTGWREVPGSQSTFDVVDGAIHVTGGRGFLETEKTWDDFVLRADVRTNGTHLNSGIFFRAMPGTEENPSHGYELQIQNEFKNGDPTQPADFGTGAIFRRSPARRIVARDNEWTTLMLAAHGPTFATWVNGYPTVVWTDDRKPHENPREGRRLEAGHISLQGHDPTTDLDFRNLQVAPCPQSAGEQGQELK